MGRKLRTDEPGGRHHVMNRGTARRNVFDGDSDRGRFLHCLGEAADSCSVAVESYCLMGNHYHLGLWCPSGGLSSMMQHLSANYTRWYNSARGTDGPLFRARFHSVPIGSERQLVAVTRYIHRNPLDLGHDPEGYRWSSYRVYAGERTAPKWLRPEVPLKLCGGRSGHRDLVRSSQASDQELRGRSWTPAELQALFGPTMSDLMAATSLCKTSVPERRIRDVQLILAADLVKVSSAHAAKYLGLASPEAARAALSRARSRLKSDPETQALLRAADASAREYVTNGV